MLITIPPTIYQRAQVAALLARGDHVAAQTYMDNQRRQGGTDWTRCSEWAVWQAQNERTA